jgi:hypothetical protein
MQNSPDDTSAPASAPVKHRTVSERLDEAEAEIARLRRVNDALMNESLNTWLTVVGDEARALAEVYSTVSWRVTRPLRLARQVQRKAAEIGVSETASVVVARLRRGPGPRA